MQNDNFTDSVIALNFRVSPQSISSDATKLRGVTHMLLSANDFYWCYALRRCDYKLQKVEYVQLVTHTW